MIKSEREHNFHYALFLSFLFTNDPKISTNRQQIITNINNTIHADAN